MTTKVREIICETVLAEVEGRAGGREPIVLAANRREPDGRLVLAGVIAPHGWPEPGCVRRSSDAGGQANWFVG